MKSVKDLDVYKLGFETALLVYKITEKFPKSEIFGLVSQMRRSAISINSNLSEGGSRNTTGEYKHFIGIAKGSVAELDFQIEIAKTLGFIDKNDYDVLLKNVERVGQMLSKLTQSLSTSHEPRITSHGA
jgi:four helix bundle protein